jgi:uracil-DNA glycosylase
MPLRKECSIAAMEANIATEVASGTPQAQAVAIAKRVLRDACRDAGKLVPTRKADDELREHGTKRQRTREFLEAALERARQALNPRDFAVIFQSARASAGGQVAARNRRDRALSPVEKALILKGSLRDMSKAEIRAMSITLNAAYTKAKRSGGDMKPVLSRAASLKAEFKRREMDDPRGPVYVALKERGKKDVRKGFSNGNSEGGMHAHGLDRRNSKTLDDGGHRHIWIIPGTGEIIVSQEDGFHQHSLGTEKTDADGAHSHRVFLSNGAVVETKLDGPHAHELMVETTGFGGLHTHALVMPDGTELESTTVAEFVEGLSTPPESNPIFSADEITRAMNELRAERAAADIGAPLPSLPDLTEAVELTIKGESIDPPTFTVEAMGDITAVGAEAGDMIQVDHNGEFIGFSKHVVPDSPEDIASLIQHWELIRKHTTQVPFVGPVDARLLFVAAAPTELELARKQALVGEDAITFEELYLAPLGMTKKDVAIGFMMPTLPLDYVNQAMCEKWSRHFIAAMKSFPHAKIVTLGGVARETLKAAGIDALNMPHPTPIRKRNNSGEATRKLRFISKALDVPLPEVAHSKNSQKSAPVNGVAAANLTDTISELRKTGCVTCRVIKTADEKQIVYGVVLDPYDIDLQTEWVPPAEIESTAHGFLKKSRIIGFEHIERAEAQIVESWVEIYPSTADYEAAMENQPHRAYKREFGDDVIHSGTWVAGVQVGDREWELHKQGKLNAFSVGGFSFKTKVTTEAMPQVEFVNLIVAP